VEINPSFGSSTRGTGGIREKYEENEKKHSICLVLPRLGKSPSLMKHTWAGKMVEIGVGWCRWREYQSFSFPFALFPLGTRRNLIASGARPLGKAMTERRCGLSSVPEGGR
jgi:hypothetical protein